MKYLMVVLTSCAGFKKAPFPVFLHSQIPAELCHGGIEKYGLYRVLNDGRKELLPYCADSVINYIGVDKDDLKKL